MTRIKSQTMDFFAKLKWRKGSSYDDARCMFYDAESANKVRASRYEDFNETYPELRVIGKKYKSQR